MSEYIENQVVEMEFDNRDFEKNVATSLKTLDTLKEKLKFENASKGFYEIQNGLNSINFTPFLGQLDDMESQFTSFMGRLELSVKDFLGSQVINEFMQLFNNTLGQIQSGGRSRAMNIEQAQFKIKGLKKDWDEVYKDMDYAVSGTAYGIDQAANAAAQFLASNIQTGDDMKAALRGISGIAAMTSSSYDEIARVFTAAAGKGRVMALELNRISLRGVNAAAALADYLNTTEAAVRKMASKGEIDFVTFAKAMDTAFGEHAKKANETFSGSLSNVRAALSRIGEIYYEPWIREMIPWFNEIRKSIDNVKNALKTAFGGLEGNTFANTLKNLLLEIGKLKVALLKSFAPTVDQVAEKVEFWNDKLAKLTATLRGVTAAVEKYAKKREKLNKQTTTTTDSADGTGSGSSEDVERTFAGITTTIAGTAITLDKEVGATVASIIDRYNALYNSQKNILQSTVNLFSKWSYTYKTSFKTLNKNLKSNKWGLEKLATDMAKLESKGVLNDAFIQNLKNMGTSGAEIVHALAQANDKDLKEYMKTWETTNGMFDTITKDWTKEAKQEAEKSLNEITGIPNATMEDYMKTYDDMFKQMGISSANGYQVGFENTFAGMEEVFNKQIEAIEAYKQALDDANESKDESSNKKYVQTFRDAYNTIDNTIKKIREYAWVETLIARISKIFETAGNIIHTVSTSIYTALESVASAFGDIWTEFNVVDGVAIEGPIQKILNLIQKVVTNFEISGERAELIKSIFKGVFSVFELGKWVINNLLDAITPLVDKLTSGEPIFLRVAGALGEFIHSVVAAIINGDSLSGAFEKLIKSIKGFFTGLFNILTGDGSGIMTTVKKVFNFITEVFSNIVDTIVGLFSNPEGETGVGFSDFLKKLFGESLGIDTVFNLLSTMFGKIGGIFDTLWKFVEPIAEIIPDVLTTTWGFIKENGDAISELLKSIIKLFTKIFSHLAEDGGAGDKIGDLFVTICDTLITLFQTLQTVLLAIKEPLEVITKNIGAFLEKMFKMIGKYMDWAGEDPERTYGAAAFFTIMTFLIKKLDKVKGKDKLFGKIGKEITGVTTATKNFFTTLSGGVKGFFKGVGETSYDKIVKLAKALLIFAAAVWILADAFTDKKNGGVNTAAIVGIAFMAMFMLAVYKFMDKMFRLQRKDISKQLDQLGMISTIKGLARAFFLIAIALAILVKAIGSVEDIWPTTLSAFLLIALVLVFMYGIVNLAMKNSEQTTGAGLMATKQMKAMALMLFTFGLAVSMILLSLVPFMLVVGAMRKLMKNEEFIDFFAMVGVLLLGIMGLLILTMVAMSQQQNYDLKSLIGMAVFVVAFSAAIGMVIGSLAALLAIIAITNKKNSTDLLVGAFVGIAAIMLMLVLVMKAVAKATQFGGVKMLAGLVGLSILCATMGKLLGIIAAMIIGFKLAGVTAEDVDNGLKILIALGVIMAALTTILAVFGGIIGQGGVANGAGAAIGIIAIAIAIFLIVKAFSQLVIALGAFLAVGGLLAYFWDDVKPGLEKMVTDLGGENGLMVQFIHLVGLGIRALAGEIYQSAPVIADAISAVFSAILYLSYQKAPMRAMAFLMMIDEILTIILKGGGVIINKLLLLFEMILIALDTNADILGYQIGHTLFTAFMYGLKGAFDALLEWEAELVDKFYEELIGTFIDEASMNETSEKIGDIIYKILAGESLEETERKEREDNRYYVPGKGWVEKTDDGSMQLAKAADSYSKSAEKAKKEVDDANKILDKDGNEVKVKELGVKWRKADYSSVTGKVENIEDNEDFAALEKEYGVTHEQVTSEKESGKITAESWSDGVSSVLNSDNNPFKSFLDSLKNDLGMQNSADEAGTTFGEKCTAAMKKVFDDKGSGLFNGFLGGPNGLAQFSKMNGDIDMQGMFTGDAKSGMLNYDSSKYADENLDNIIPLDGTNPLGADFYGNDGTTGGEDFWTSMQQNTADQAESNTKLNETLETLNTAIDGIILVNKNSKIQITAMMDKTKVGQATYPIMDTLADEANTMKDSRLATSGKRRDG
jgi:tape measure domain-containing protein